jgi:hypothetical protein
MYKDQYHLPGCTDGDINPDWDLTRPNIIFKDLYLYLRNTNTKKLDLVQKKYLVNENGQEIEIDQLKIEHWNCGPKVIMDQDERGKISVSRNDTRQHSSSKSEVLSSQVSSIEGHVTTVPSKRLYAP